MRTSLKRALWGTLIAGGITLFGATVANAAETTGDDGLLSGTQAETAITAPVSVVNNAISVVSEPSCRARQPPRRRPPRHLRPLRHLHLHPLRHLPRRAASRGRRPVLRPPSPSIFP